MDQRVLNLKQAADHGRLRELPVDEEERGQGLARLELMVTEVLPQLTAVGPQRHL